MMTMSAPSAPESGELSIAELNPIRYRGYYFDAETGYYYLQTRYYNPEWRRFLNADALFIAGDDMLMGANMYAYCNGNPVMFSDPSGMGVVGDWLKGAWNWFKGAVSFVWSAMTAMMDFGLNIAPGLIGFFEKTGAFANLIYGFTDGIKATVFGWVVGAWNFTKSYAEEKGVPFFLGILGVFATGVLAGIVGSLWVGGWLWWQFSNLMIYDLIIPLVNVIAPLRGKDPADFLGGFTTATDEDMIVFEDEITGASPTINHAGSATVAAQDFVRSGKIRHVNLFCPGVNNPKVSETKQEVTIRLTNDAYKSIDWTMIPDTYASINKDSKNKVKVTITAKNNTGLAAALAWIIYPMVMNRDWLYIEPFTVSVVNKMASEMKVTVPIGTNLYMLPTTAAKDQQDRSNYIVSNKSDSVMTVRGYCKGEDGKDFYLLKTKVTHDEFDGPLWMFVEQKDTELYVEPVKHVFEVPKEDIARSTVKWYFDRNIGWPIGKLENGKYVEDRSINNLSAPFGYYVLSGDEHRGIDINIAADPNANPPVPTGTINGKPLLAVTDGLVIYVGTDPTHRDGNPGYAVSIESKIIDPVTGKPLIFSYHHMLEKPNFVANISEVYKGQQINYVGDTGYSFGPHLHFEVSNSGVIWGNEPRINNRVNPVFFYPRGAFKGYTRIWNENKLNKKYFTPDGILIT